MLKQLLDYYAMKQGPNHPINKRSGRDSNPRCPLQGTLTFQASTFNHSVTTPVCPFYSGPLQISGKILQNPVLEN